MSAAEEIAETIKDSISYATEAVSMDGGRAWVDGIGDAVTEVLSGLKDKGYVIVKRIDVLVASSFLMAPAANEFGQQQADAIVEKWREFES